MGKWTDPEVAPTSAAKAGRAGKAGDVSGQVQATTSALDQATSGRGPDALGSTAADVRNALSALAGDLTVPPAIANAVEKAFSDFKAHAPSAEVMNAAEKKVTDAKAAKEAALAAPGAETPGTDADKAAWDASKAYADACTELRDLKAERRRFREVLWADLRRAIALAKKIKTGSSVDGGTGGYGTPGGRQATPGGGYGTPGGTTAGGSTPAPAPKTTTGTTPGATPATPAPKAET
ncbi:MAG: hypothetical protein E6Q55_21140, partial [Mycolicibacterium mageritense]